MAIGDLVVNLIARTKQFTNPLGGALSSLRSFATQAAALTGIVGGTIGLSASLQAARTQIQAEQKLAAVITATGGAAGLSAREIAGYASELQSLTNFGDEATIAAASVLATFKDIKGDVFKQALAAAQDLSTVMGQDLKSSVVQLGKALNDPIQGVTALTRVGVSFSDQQKEQIRSLQTSGDLLGAQRIILKELQTEFGGAAKALADPWTQFKNVLGDLGENIGFVLMPSINALSQSLTAMLNPVTGATNGFKGVGDILGRVTELFLSMPRTIALVGAAFLGYLGVLRAVAAGQAVVQALSGPKGWIALAAGVALATVATTEIASQFDRIASSANSATGATQRMAKSATDWRAEWAAAPGEFDRIAKNLERLQQLQQMKAEQPLHGGLADALAKPVIAGLQSIASGAANPLSSVRQEADRLVGLLDLVRRQAGDLGPELAASLTAGLQRQVGEVTGISQAIADARQQLGRLQGDSEFGQQFAKFAQEGALPSQLKELRTLFQDINAVKVAPQAADMITKLKDELDVLRGVATATDIELRNLGREGFNESQLGAIGELLKQRDALQAQKTRGATSSSSGGQFAAALTRGSSEAISALNRAAFGKASSPNAKLEKLTEKGNVLLAQVVNTLKDQGDAGDDDEPVADFGWAG